jgi:bla regulator protein blaR1
MNELLSSLSNHLWQSTLFAALAAVGAFALRGNHAKVRYRLWLATSVKFLLPFSPLVTLGTRVEPPALAPAIPVAAVEQITVSFSPIPAAVSSTNLWPALLGAAWLLGSLAVLFWWFRRWLVIHRALRSASPLELAAPIPIRSSPTAIEPGVFGIFRPVLLLPDGIAGKLSAEELDSILAHELAHVHRRDNLTAAVHMAIETIFWFHPLVWWIGARLVEERERACDEEVLRLGKRPQAYAEGILNVCKFYLESPLPCASGVTGADLQQRIEEIMTNRISRKLTPVRKGLLTAATLVAIAVPVCIGVLHAQAKPDDARFEVASIRPGNPEIKRAGLQFTPGGGLQATNITLKFLVQFAYDVQWRQVSGGPGWIETDWYNVIAKGPSDSNQASPAEQRQLSRRRLQTLLSERFGLVVRRESKVTAGYALIVAKGGPKLKETALPESLGIRGASRGEISGEGVSLELFANWASGSTGRNVVDKTGLTGRYDFTLRWSPQPGESGPSKGGVVAAPAPADAGDPSGPTLFTAIQEQLGLKLEPQQVSADFIVIERAEKPSEN